MSELIKNIKYIGVCMWFEESHKEDFQQRLKVNNKIFDKDSEYQKVEVYSSEYFGNILALNGSAIYSSKDVSNYAEMMAQVPMCSHPKIESVLIIGGGSGATANEVLKHKNVQKVDVVEIDEVVVEACKAHFDFSNVWADSRVNLIDYDGIQYIRNVEDSSYDLIIVEFFSNLNDDIDISMSAFFAHVKRALKDNGILVTQGKSVSMEIDSTKDTMAILGESFKIVMPYRYDMSVSLGINRNIIFASNKYHPTADMILNKSDFLDGMKYYNSDLHKASFILPNYAIDYLKDVAKN
jgi:spermidine synthase